MSKLYDWHHDNPTLKLVRLFVLPFDGERDVFTRVRKIRMLLAVLSAGAACFGLVALLSLVSTANNASNARAVHSAAIWQPIFSGGYFIWQIFGLKRLAREDRYRLYDVLEAFWPLLYVAGALMIGIAGCIFWIAFAVFKFAVALVGRTELPIAALFLLITVVIAPILVFVQLQFAKKYWNRFREVLALAK